MNVWDYVIIIIIALAVIMAIRHCLKTGHSCSMCSGSCACCRVNDEKRASAECHKQKAC